MSCKTKEALKFMFSFATKQIPVTKQSYNENKLTKFSCV